MDTLLLPCPLCGGKAEIKYGSEFGDSYSEGPDGWTIFCTICYLNIFQYIEDENDKENIIKKWNNRVSVNEK